MDLSTALSGASLLIDQIRTAVAARDDALITRALTDMQQRLMDAMGAGLLAAESASRLQRDNTGLASRVAELEAQLEDRQRRNLFKLPTGAVVYRVEATEHEPLHYLCQICMDAGQRSVLQMEEHDSYLRCKVNAVHSVPAKPGSGFAAPMAVPRHDPFADF